MSLRSFWDQVTRRAEAALNQGVQGGTGRADVAWSPLADDPPLRFTAQVSRGLAQVRVGVQGPDDAEDSVPRERASGSTPLTYALESPGGLRDGHVVIEAEVDLRHEPPSDERPLVALTVEAAQAGTGQQTFSVEARPGPDLRARLAVRIRLG